MADRLSEERKWAQKQVPINDITTGLTAAGATALGTMLAGKTRLGGKVLPKKFHAYLKTGNADDVRSTIALASMVGGTASGVHWGQKLRADAKKRTVSLPVSDLTPEQKAENLAKALTFSPAVASIGVAGKQILRRGGVRRPRIRGIYAPRIRRSY